MIALRRLSSPESLRRHRATRSRAAARSGRVEPLKVPQVVTIYTEDDLVLREFLQRTSRRLLDDRSLRAA